jgi:hypothetical protein
MLCSSFLMLAAGQRHSGVLGHFAQSGACSITRPVAPQR